LFEIKKYLGEQFSNSSPPEPCLLWVLGFLFFFSFFLLIHPPQTTEKHNKIVKNMDMFNYLSIWMNVFVVLTNVKIQKQRIISFVLFYIYFYGELKIWMKKNQGLPLYFLFEQFGNLGLWSFNVPCKKRIEYSYIPHPTEYIIKMGLIQTYPWVWDKSYLL